MNRRAIAKISLVTAMANLGLALFASTPAFLFAENMGAACWAANQKTALPVPVHEKIAVVVGVGTFTDKGIAPLPQARASAEAVAETLSSRGVGRFKYENIVVLKDEDGDFAQVADLLGSGLTRRALQSDMIVVYLAGRSMLSHDGKKILFCCHDSRVDSPDDTGIDIESALNKIKSRIQSKNILCFLDLSPVKPDGATTAKQSAKDRLAAQTSFDIARMADETGVTIFSANELGQDSTVALAGMSNFAFFLVENLKFFKGTVTLSMLTQAVSDQVRKTTNAAAASQSPRLAMAQDNPAISSLVLGMPTGKAPSSSTLSHVKFGYDYGRLGMEHPELLPGAGIGIPDGTSLIKRSRLPNPAMQGDEPLDNTPANKPIGEINLKPYIKQARNVIHAKWNPPKGYEGKKVVVAFTIVRDGSIEDPQIVEASGTETIDQSALAALKAASPLEPLPAGSLKSVRLRYEFDGSEEPEMKATVKDSSQQ